MWTTLESILTDARVKIGQALAEDRPTSADDTVRGLFPHQPEVAQDRPLVQALIRVAATGAAIERHAG